MQDNQPAWYGLPQQKEATMSAASFAYMY